MSISSIAFITIEDEKPLKPYKEKRYKKQSKLQENVEKVPINEEEPPARQEWNSPIEFLLACISMCVGLGNVWRFPYTAYENGGGAFFIPYLIVLFLVGRPLYYLEMCLGQFSGFTNVKIFESICPAMAGIGVGQVIASIICVSYYAMLMSIFLLYFGYSFMNPLPWSYCDPKWANLDTCVAVGDSAPQDIEKTLSKMGNLSMSEHDHTHEMKSQNLSVTEAPAEYESSVNQFFRNYILHELPYDVGVEDGLGTVDWKLFLGVFVSWLVIFLVSIKGVKSMGKASYVTALFPYVILITLVAKAATLPGAKDGILYFVKPQWEALLEPRVWFAALSQMFYSLGLGYGGIIMYTSFNPFKHNVYRDAVIISVTDTITSFSAGIITFAILGNLAVEIDKPINDVVNNDMGLVFISYPEVLARFNTVPQLFSVLFFLMMFIVGIGSGVTMSGSVVNVICDQFPKLKKLYVTIAVCFCFCCICILFTTQGGQYVQKIVDFFGCTYTIVILMLFELIAVFWIYGLNKFCSDIEFMLNRSVGWYWKISWAVLAPIGIIVIIIQTFVDWEPLSYGEYQFTPLVNGVGWIITMACLIWTPIIAIYVIYKSSEKTLFEKIQKSFEASESWGPRNPEFRREWKLFKEANRDKRQGILEKLMSNFT